MPTDLDTLRELAERLEHATECEDRSLTLFEAERLARALLAALDVVEAADVVVERLSFTKGLDPTNDWYGCGNALADALAKFKEASRE